MTRQTLWFWWIMMIRNKTKPCLHPHLYKPDTTNPDTLKSHGHDKMGEEKAESFMRRICDVKVLIERVTAIVGLHFFLMDNRIKDEHVALVEAPYIQKATALIGVPRKVGGNQFRYMLATFAILR